MKSTALVLHAALDHGIDPSPQFHHDVSCVIPSVSQNIDALKPVLTLGSGRRSLFWFMHTQLCEQCERIDSVRFGSWLVMHDLTFSLVITLISNNMTNEVSLVCYESVGC